MEQLSRVLLFLLLVIAILWLGLTLWVEREGPPLLHTVGPADAAHQALVVYDPDPIYDLDAQLGEAAAEALVERGFRSMVATVAAAREQPTPDLFVLCANTYNWRPDRAITRFIDQRSDLRGRPVVALTLGSGSTEAAQRVLEERITRSGARLIGSRSVWLLRPNDEQQMDRSNVDVARDQVRDWMLTLTIP